MLGGLLFGLIIVSGDYGGRIGDYAIKVAKARDSEVRITGVCASACTLYLGLPSRNICITQGAVFKFHAPRHRNPKAAQAAKRYMMSRYPSWVRRFLNSKGGLTGRLVTMPYSYARAHMRACK